MRYTILGTAHVSQQSVDAVNTLIEQHEPPFDAVAVELCEGRYRAMTQPQDLQQLDLLQVIRQGKIPMVAANLALAGYQRRLAEQLGIEPGAEQKAAIVGAESRDIPVWRIDREVGLTLRRCYAAVSWWRRFGIVAGLMGSLLADEEIEQDEIEKLKEGDMLESAFSEFANRSPALYQALIAERDHFMSASLRHKANQAGQRPREVLVVIGAGHLAGLSEHVASDDDNPMKTRHELTQAPPPGNLGKWLSALLVFFVLGGFVYGFWHGFDVGTDLLLNWVLITGIGGALGCIAAGGHPLSILAAFIASPVTPLHPALASGTVSAFVEAWKRRPKVEDFSRLRDDIGSARGWWRNHVLRIFLNFFLTSMGTALAVYVAGWKMIQTLF